MVGSLSRVAILMIHAWPRMSVVNSIRWKRRGILWLNLAGGYDVNEADGTRVLAKNGC
jgi:hypothetical protein